MKKYNLQLVVLTLLLVASTGLTVAGEVKVTNNGQPIEGATVSIESLEGKELVVAETDSKGASRIDIPGAAADQAVMFKVSEKGGNVTQQVIAQPPGKPWHLVALDTSGGIIGYSEETCNHLRDAAKPIVVGKNSDVGSGAPLKDKAKGMAGGLFGKAAGGLLGGGGTPFGGGFSRRGKSGGGPNIKTKKDPIAKKEKRILTDPATGVKIAVGTKMTPDGLLVSTNILKSPDDGTFQTIYLMDSQGRKAGPTRYDVYEMYRNWKLTVSWTKDRYVNGQHVSHQEGGWSEEGRDFLGTFKVPQENHGIWDDMGFSNAAQGIRSMGTLFPVNYATRFDHSPMTLVVHTTRPGEDTVTTTPFVIGISEDCPCATQQRESIMDELPSDKEAEDLEIKRGRLQKLRETINSLNQDITDLLEEIDKEKRIFEQRSRELEEAKSNPLVSGNDEIRLQTIINRREESVALLEEGLDVKYDLLKEAEEEVRRLTSGESIMDEIETSRENDPCDCGKPQIRLVNIPSDHP